MYSMPEEEVFAIYCTRRTCGFWMLQVTSLNFLKIQDGLDFEEPLWHRFAFAVIISLPVVAVIKPVLTCRTDACCLCDVNSVITKA